MSWVAVGITGGTALLKGAGALIGGRKAKKEKKKAEKEIKAEKAAQAKELQKGIDTQVRAEKDLANEFAGQASISPETQYEKNLSERGTSSAIDKAMRAGASTTEIMNMVSGLTAKGQLRGQQISAKESTRRGSLLTASKQAAMKAAATGLAGKQAQVQLQNQAYGLTQEKQNQINAATAQNFGFFSDALNDVGAAYLYASQNTFGSDDDSGLGAIGGSAAGKIGGTKKRV